MTSATTTASLGLKGGIVEALNLEWDRLDHDHRGIVGQWASRHQVLSGCRSFRDVLDTIRGRPDDALHALLAEVSNGNQLAGRVVLQSMIGRLVMMARRDVKAGVDDYISVMWFQIQTYPLARRPVRIAANLALDTLKAVQREHRWLVRGEVTTWPPGELLDEILADAFGSSVSTAFDDLEAPEILDAACGLDIIDRKTHALLRSVYLEGLTGSEAARRHGSSVGSIRVRCSRAVRRMSESASVLCAA